MVVRRAAVPHEGGQVDLVGRQSSVHPPEPIPVPAAGPDLHSASARALYARGHRSGQVRRAVAPLGRQSARPRHSDPRRVRDRGKQLLPLEHPQQRCRDDGRVRRPDIPGRRRALPRRVPPHRDGVARGRCDELTWFFHADTLYYFAQPSWNALRWAYPGDDYVDWLGLSLYAFPKFDGSGYTTFAEKLQSYHEPGIAGTYDEITSFSSRPLAIVELGFNRVPVEARVPWVTDAAATVKSGAFPRLNGLTWYVTAADDFNSLITASPAFQTAFRAAFDDPFFAAKPQFTGNCSPIAPKHVIWRSGRVLWSPVPNAGQYEVWRGSKKLDTTPLTYVNAPKRGPYRVRSTNIAGASAF